MAMKSPLMRTTGALVLGATIAFSHVAPAHAFFFLTDPAVKKQLDFLCMCTGLAFSDPAAHAKICKPKHIVPVIVREEGEAPAPVKPAPIQTPPSDDDDEEIIDSCDGSCPA